MNNFDEILKKLPRSISDDLKSLPASVISEVEEVRLRCGRNIRLKSHFFEKAIAHIITSEELRSTLNSLIKYSFYAYEQDLANGFVTIEGGHRVGVCGKVVIKDGRPTLIKEISSLNIRFAKEIKGCADKLTSEVLDDNGKVINTLIVSPPGCGKTTMIRDLTRNISNRRLQVAVCDERSEIAGMYCGRTSFDLGSRTDVLDGCDKAYGIPMLIRSMAPDVIVTDEIGKTEDIRAVQQCLSTGVGLITTIHGSNLDEIESSAIGSLIREKVFKRIVFLTKEGGPGTIKEVLHA
jgi:stage III sporulation protein AA